MKKTAFIIAFLFLMKLAAGQSYDEPTQCIKLKFGHSLRIPFHYLTIELLLYYGKSDKPIKVIVKSSPSNNDQQYEYSKIDTVFFIDKVKFNEIIDILKSIPPSDIYSQNTMGEDGTACVIEFGNYQNYVTYSAWTPNYNTNERKLETFLMAFKMIIKIANLDPDKIL